MDERKIIEKALDGNAVLFLGSGFSVGAKSFAEEHKFCQGEGLCNKLITEGKIDVTGESENDLKDLQYISTRYLETNTKKDLISLLKKNFRCQAIGHEHEVIAKIKWKKIYTTNYDDIMEVASRDVSILREAVVATDKLGEIHNSKNSVIHINGFIGSLTEETLSTTFKLTQESYRVRTISDSDWAISLYSDIKNAKSVIFIGYSLDYDMELQQIFACDEHLKEKCLFVVKSPSKRQMTTMKQFGIVYEDGLKDFSKLIEQVEASYTPVDNQYELRCMKQVCHPKKFAETVTSDDMIRLFVDGIVKDDITYSIFSNEYLFERDCISEIVDFLKLEGKLVIIHSDLANGKSVALKQLEVKLNQTGNVYYLNEELNEDLLADLEYISTQQGNQFLICENYNQLIDGDAWNLLRRFQASNIKYIFTARSYINDNFYNRVLNDMSLNYKTMGMYNLNELSESEIKRLVALIRKYDIWGANLRQGQKKQMQFISSRCNGELRNVLLEVYKSNNVQNKINDIVKPIFKNELSKDILLISFICNIISVEIGLDDIAIILGRRVNALYFDEYRELKELLLVENNELRIKSSSIASYIIGNNSFNNDILRLLNQMVTIFAKHSYVTKYKIMLKLIISFSNLRLAFNRSDADIGRKYINFYENARKTGYYEKNQFFWIQYAIAVMDVKDYGAAQIYLENASSCAQKKYDEDSYQVESLKARLLLEKTIYNNDVENAYANFEEAHNLICSNKTPERHYPFRQVSQYIQYYKTFYKGFNSENKVAFVFMCTEIKKKMQEYLNRENPYERKNERRSNEIKRISNQIDIIINEMANSD